MLYEHTFRYVECDVPEGVTLDDWRSTRVPPAQRRRLVRLPSLRLGRRRNAGRAHGSH